MSDKLTRMARELLCISEDLPNRFCYGKKPYHTVDDFEVYAFEQAWGSTALGFGGIGGQKITSARTSVFVPESCDERCFVYFCGRFAYAVPYSKCFMEDVKKCKMEPVYKAGKYTKE